MEEKKVKNTDIDDILRTTASWGHAEEITRYIEKYDPVLLETIRAWSKDYHKWSALFVAGALTCYYFLKKKADGEKKELPSFTALGRTPVLLSGKEFHLTVDYMAKHDKKIMEQTGRIAMSMDSLAAECIFLPQGGGSGALVGADVIYMYGAIRSID